MKILYFIERNKFSVFGAILIHIIIFISLNAKTVTFNMNYQEDDERERTVAVIDYSEQEEEIEDPISEPDPTLENPSTPLANVAANATQEKTTYTNTKSAADIDKEVWNELKQMEKSEQQKLALDNPELTSEMPDKGADVNPNLVKNDADENASYGMDVMAVANYHLPNRNAQKERIPSYICKEQGIVKIDIKVNQKGMVVQADIDESGTNTSNECLRNNALSYAKKWKFSQNFQDPIRKQGWIKFTYEAQ